MMQEARTKQAIKRKTISQMKALGVYKKHYESIIDIFSELCEQYEILTIKFQLSDYEFQVETMQGGSKKAPIVAALESLRKDILAYSDRLCLNPKALESVTPEQPNKSKLSQVLSGLK